MCWKPSVVRSQRHVVQDGVYERTAMVYSVVRVERVVSAVSSPCTSLWAELGPPRHMPGLGLRIDDESTFLQRGGEVGWGGECTRTIL